MTRAVDVDRAFVVDKRGRNTPWSAIARMAGCSERDLRRRFDLDFALRDPAPATNARDRVAAALVRQGLTADQARVLARLWAANGAPVPNPTLASGVCPAAHMGDFIRTLRADAKRLGVAFARMGRTPALTPASIGVLSDLAQVRAAT